MNLADIDWTNAVVLPLVMTVLVGFPLAVYGGFVAARYVVFCQEIQRTREGILSVVELFAGLLREPEIEPVRLKCLVLFLPFVSSLGIQLNQARAAGAVAAISDRLQARLVEEWTASRAVLGQPIRSEVEKYSSEKIIELMNWSLDELDKIRPNYWRLLGLGGKAAKSAA